MDNQGFFIGSRVILYLFCTMKERTRHAVLKGSCCVKKNTESNENAVFDWKKVLLQQPHRAGYVRYEFGTQKSTFVPILKSSEN